MSLHTMMSARERQLQAAAICQEIHGGTSDNEIDLGRKMNTPKDIMLEELSLSSNRGSRLFKMRQKRSEKYTFENIQNEANMQMNNGVAPPAPSTETEENKNDGDSLEVDQSPKTPPNTPDPRTPPNPESIAPGYGGPLKDVPHEKFNSTAVPRSYHSPWSQAIIADPSLADTLISKIPVPEPKPEGPEYKSFNRVATPFGGFDKASKLITYKAPEADPNQTTALPKIPEFQDTVLKRPTFNRTAMGWVTEGTPLILPTVDLEHMMIPESEDL
ncbi:myozenin-2-like [Megalops cyprinoides]|uniref:myozenin-2-like n=1 Tax=Megalops cyprinoides TaxID=118141 RepID=UPI001864FFCF|nr:myozenin-2-like [Megalops cyprinoides]XP_036407500.1 myozenin-2-like [Megalops cyprinoides]